jgi:hypothetical protein
MNDHSAAPSDEADMEESLPRVKPFDDLEELD